MSSNNYTEVLGDRASSRVLAPPGGKSNFSFGNVDAPAPVKTSACQVNRNKSSLDWRAAEENSAPQTRSAHSSKANESQWKNSYSPKAPVVEATKTEAFTARNKSSVFSRSPLKENTSHAMPQGVKKQTEQTFAAPTTKPSTRVLAAPGGGSSITFG